MTAFCIKLAGIPIAVHAMFDSTRKFCREYLTEEPPQFTVTVEPAHIEEMRLRDQKNAVAEGRTPVKRSGRYLETLALCRVIMDRLIDFHVLLFHGSAVELNGRVYLFTARSGTGKTTHSRLWRKIVPGCSILNGDKPLLLFKEGKIYVCGTPWMGKEQYGRNKILPLESLCILARDTVNHIEENSLSECFETLLGQCHIPEGGKNFLSAIQLVKQFSSIRLYRLGCNMEDEAALAAFQGMVMQGKSYQEVLNENGSLLYRNSDSAMRPLIRAGRDICCIVRRPAHLKKFDTVLYRRQDGEYALRRIQKTLPDGEYSVAGDNSTVTERVKDENISGVLSAVCRDSRIIRASDFRYRLYSWLHNTFLRRVIIRIIFPFSA